MLANNNFELSRSFLLRSFKYSIQVGSNVGYLLQEVGYCTEITKPHESIVNIFFCMFPCSKRHSIRVYLDKYYLNNLSFYNHLVFSGKYYLLRKLYPQQPQENQFCKSRSLVKLFTKPQEKRCTSIGLENKKAKFFLFLVFTPLGFLSRSIKVVK